MKNCAPLPHSDDSISPVNDFSRPLTPRPDTHLEDQLGIVVLDHQGVEDGGQSLVELDVNNGTDDRDDLAGGG